MIRITEEASKYRNLEKMSVEELTSNLNKEDKTVALAIEKALPQLNTLISTIVSKIEQGGRLFYVGAGSGGRLSVLDVIELPTTYGVSPELFNVILAGGKEHLIEALEEKEDDVNGSMANASGEKCIPKGYSNWYFSQWYYPIRIVRIKSMQARGNYHCLHRK
jgi:N-acetylmuramic acid 6-phosphate etherase